MFGLCQTFINTRISRERVKNTFFSIALFNFSVDYIFLINFPYLYSYKVFFSKLIDFFVLFWLTKLNIYVKIFEKPDHKRKNNYHITMKYDKIKPFIFYFCAFILIFALSIKYHTLDFDLWDRLIMGKCVFETGHVCFNDIISYTSTHTWFDPEWLSSAFIYFIQLKFGLIGLISLKAFFLFLIILAINFTIRKLSNNSVKPYNFGYFLILVFVMYQSGILFSTVRCQLLTFVLLAFWIFLLEKIRKGNEKLLFLMPLIMLFWLNTHGACIAGVGVFFLYIIGEALNKKPIKKLVIAYFFTCLMFFINPWGIDYLKFIFDSSYLDRCWISEWQSSFSGQVFSFSYYKFLLLLVWIFEIFNIFKNKLKYKDLDKTKLILLFVLSVLSAKYIKHIWLFMTIISIYYYSDFYKIYNFFMEKVKNYLQIEDNSILLIKKFKEAAFVVAVLAFSSFVIFKEFNKFVIDKNFYNTYPVKISEFIRANNLKGNVLAPFHVSSFLGYKLYPNIKIHMDGRQEQVYTPEIFDEMMFFFLNATDDPAFVLKKYDINILILQKDYKILSYKDKFKDYYHVLDDGQYELYLKNTLKRFKFIEPKLNRKIYQKNLFKTNIDFKRSENE